MNREEVLNLIDSATLQAIKTLTTNGTLKRTKFIEIQNVPVNFSILKIISFIRLSGNLNFLFFIHKKMINGNNNCNWILGCKNSLEFNQFLWQYKELNIEGCVFAVVPARKELELRHAKLNGLSTNNAYKVLSMIASSSYSKFFPTERIMELLTECEAANGLRYIDGIYVNYRHATRMISDEITVSTSDVQQIQVLKDILTEMGNINVSEIDAKPFLMDKKIWARQLTFNISENNVPVFSISLELADNNIITNSLSINSIRNSII